MRSELRYSVRYLSLALSACGRVGFEVASTSGSADAGNQLDAYKTPCGASATAPDPIRLMGDVFTYTDFTNGRMHDVTVTT